MSSSNQPTAVVVTTTVGCTRMDASMDSGYAVLQLIGAADLALACRMSLDLNLQPWVQLAELSNFQTLQSPGVDRPRPRHFLHVAIYQHSQLGQNNPYP